MLYLLQKRSFGAMTLSQFLGAFNDNAFKTLVLILVASVEAGQADSPWIAGSGLAGLGQALPQALFAVPFVLFGPVTGALADRLSKSAIIKAANVLEVIVMAAATVAFVAESYEALMAAIFLMGTQSAIFGPSKYGVIKELVGTRELSRANALIQSSTMVAILLGMVVGGAFADHLEGSLWTAGLWYVGFATLGWLASLRIERLRAANPARELSWNPLVELVRHWRATGGNRYLILSICASALFYLIAATIMPIVVAYGTATLGLNGTAAGALYAFTIVGILAGALLAGRISGDRIEGGLVPLGLLGMAGSSFLVQADPDAVWLLATSLFGLGVSAGLFTIPIRCLIQALPREGQRGGVQGLAETMDFAGILLAAPLFYLFDKSLALSPPQMFLCCGVILLAFAVTTLAVTADFFVRLVLLGLTHTLYRLRVRGVGRVPAEGGALLVANHLSFVDALLVAAAAPRRVRFLMYRSYFHVPLVGWFARRMGAIPVARGDPRGATVAALADAATAAAAGELVCIFAEGEISRTGTMLPFARGLERIAVEARVPIVPVALDHVWGSVFSFERGRFFWKLPRRVPYPVDVLFGEPLPGDTPAWQVRARVQELVAEGRCARDGRRESLAWRFARAAKDFGRRPAAVDSEGRRLTYRGLLVAALAARAALRRQLGPEARVAVLLPASTPSVVANVALTLDGRTTVQLNALLPNATLAELCERAGARRLVTSRALLEATGREAPLPGERVLFLEDLPAAVTRGDRVRAVLLALLPAPLLARLVTRSKGEDVATVLFSSGSSGPPKGVELTHANVLSNARSALEVLPIGPDDAMLCVLPFFHSFGYTVTLWTSLLGGLKGVYHPNPLDARVVARLIPEERVTVLLATPTFYQAWLRRLRREDVSSVRVAVSGAERLRPALAEAFEQRLGITLLEGYGCTECSPVVSFNVPEVEGLSERQQGARQGTVGRPLPGVAVRIVDPDTREPRAPGDEGLLEVKGPNVMKGYLRDPAGTAEVLRDGWYETGDVARLDRDGFLVITDRLARFAKIGGEMVPHGRVEEELAEVVGRLSAGEPVPPTVAVTSVPDDQKGERLVVLHTHMPVPVERVLEELRKKDLPALFLPRAASFVEVESIPTLASGKLDLRGLRAVAAERSA